MAVSEVKPGQRVRVEQSIQTREGSWTTAVEGEVVALAAKATGSWFAHGKNDKLWLRRMRLKRDDGEFVELVLDPATQIEVLKDAPVAK